MNSRKSRRRNDRPAQVLLFAGLAILSLSWGCARKPWGEPIAGDRYSATIAMLEEMRIAETKRSACIDADVNIFLTSTVKNRAVSGYVQLMQPSSVKFVSSNPLGQPLVAFVSDGKTVQFVNTIDGYFTDGTLASFAKTFDIPKVASESDWGTWLTGRLPRGTTVTEIREDEKQRGIWIGVADHAVKKGSDIGGVIREHVLIDPEKRVVLERAFTNTNGAIDARVSYADLLPETAVATPLQPGTITISGLDYSGKLVLEFSALQAMENCRTSGFTLQRPPGYTYQPLPAN